MTKTNPPTPLPRFMRNTRRAVEGLAQSVSFCLVLALSVTLFAISENYGSTVIVHEHESVHQTADHDPHYVPDVSHEDHHHDENGHGDDGHHHHLSSAPCVAMLALTQTQHAFFHQATRLTFAQANERCPDSPVFELIKPPQVS